MHSSRVLVVIIVVNRSCARHHWRWCHLLLWELAHLVLRELHILMHSSRKMRLRDHVRSLVVKLLGSHRYWWLRNWGCLNWRLLRPTSNGRSKSHCIKTQVCKLILRECYIRVITYFLYFVVVALCEVFFCLLCVFRYLTSLAILLLTSLWFESNFCVLIWLWLLNHIHSLHRTKWDDVCQTDFDELLLNACSRLFTFNVSFKLFLVVYIDIVFSELRWILERHNRLFFAQLRHFILGLCQINLHLAYFNFLRHIFLLLSVFEPLRNKIRSDFVINL
jgi:hypothetical protein